MESYNTESNFGRKQSIHVSKVSQKSPLCIYFIAVHVDSY